MKILFVCTGNLCRSPMAEMLLRHKLNEKKLRGIEVASAGVMAYDGATISEYSKKVMEDNHIYVDANFRSRQLTLDHIVQYDLVLTMTMSHKMQIVHIHPEYAEKIWTLNEYIDSNKNNGIDDPYGMLYKTYERVYFQLDRLIDKLIYKLGH